MDYFNLNSALRENKLYFFTLKDIMSLFTEAEEKTLKNNLARRVSKEYLTRLRRNLYELKQGVVSDLYAANRLHESPCVSLETALSIYNIIPDVAAAVTSVNIRSTRRFKNKYGSFFLRCRKLYNSYTTGNL